MKIKIINLIMFLVIMVGSLNLDSNQLQAEQAFFDNCPGGWGIECITGGDTFICCSLCQANGEVGGCISGKIPAEKE